MRRVKAALILLASCMVYSAIVALIDIVVIYLFVQELRQSLYLLSFVLLIEGGISLVVGGGMASFSTAFGKISETILHSEPWDAKRLREAESNARVWIATGLLLFLFGLLVSAI
jgi:hypothetical protein